jgi:hypothetical protein
MRKSHRSLRWCLAMLLLLATAPAAQGQIADLRTEAEELEYARHTSHDRMVEYLQTLQAQSLDMRLGTYGKTREGRELVYAVFSRPLVSKPWEAMVSGKPVVLLAANIHGGERTYRESLLVLLRQMAERGTPVNRMLDDMIIVVAPSINPDGLEAQPNPTRTNAFGFDMNRDYMKLTQPEIVQYLGNLVQQWRPHLVVDGHNGGARPYNLTYQCGGAAGGDQRLTLICDQEIFPAIDRRVEAGGYLSWYYGRDQDRERWTGLVEHPRMGHNYGPMANIISILFEAPGGQNLATGAAAGVYGHLAVLEFVQQNARRIMELVEDARAETVRIGKAAEGQIPVTQRFVAADYRVNYKIVETVDDEQRIVDVTDAEILIKPEATLLRDRPWAYILPRQAVDAVAMLLRHGILVEQLQEPVELEVQAYILNGIEYRSHFGHPAGTFVSVGEVVTVSREFPRGSYVVPTGQTMGRIVTHILEAESGDNIVTWNTMDAWLPKPQLARIAAGGDEEGTDVQQTQQVQQAQQARPGQQPGQQQASEPPPPPYLPIFKLMQPTALSTRIMDNW